MLRCIDRAGSRRFAGSWPCNSAAARARIGSRSVCCSSASAGSASPALGQFEQQRITSRPPWLCSQPRFRPDPTHGQHYLVGNGITEATEAERAWRRRFVGIVDVVGRKSCRTMSLAGRAPPASQSPRLAASGMRPVLSSRTAGIRTAPSTSRPTSGALHVDVGDHALQPRPEVRPALAVLRVQPLELRPVQRSLAADALPPDSRSVSF
jgi:hypothetical protein